MANDNGTLNSRQMKFCRLIAFSGMDATSAYMEAGYEVKDRNVGSVNASRLLGTARIQEEIEKLRDAFRQELAQAEVRPWTDYIGEAQEVLLDLMRNARSETVRLNAACEVVSRVEGRPDQKVHLLSASQQEEAVSRFLERWATLHGGADGQQRH